uniref:Major facilitator superfamily (MFS) profile domain-containing protein n=1 Tax=Gasterosteus aculeatus aculeatus TaxID=481459 RepID=A0AAQ4PAN8_GASAC
MAGVKQPVDNGSSFSSKVINIVFVTLLLDLLGFTLILPLLPSILDHYAQTGDGVYQSLQSVVDWFREAVGIPMEKKYNTVLFGGLIGSLFSLLQFLSSPVTGALSDRHGRRPMLLLTTLGLMSSYAIWAVSRSFSMFLLFRVIGGICKGNVSLCTAIVADLPCPKARNRGMAMIGIAFSLGFTVGPLMGAYFALSSRTAGNVFYQTPALLASAFSVADLLFIWVMMPETLTKDVKASSSGFGDPGDLLNPLSLFHFSAVIRTRDPPPKERMQKLRALGLVYFCYLFLFSGLEFTLSFLTHQRFNFTSMQQGKMFFFIGVIMASIQGGYARRIKPGQHIGAVRVVGASSSCISKISSNKQSPCWKHTMHYFTFVCVTIFLFLGNHVIDPSVCAHRALLECNDALRWPGVVLICGRDCGSVPVDARVRSRDVQSERHRDGDPAQLGRPRQSTGTGCVVLRLLDSWSPGLLSSHISLLHYSSGSPEEGQKSEGGVKDRNGCRDIL